MKCNFLFLRYVTGILRNFKKPIYSEQFLIKFPTNFTILISQAQNAFSNRGGMGIQAVFFEKLNENRFNSLVRNRRNKLSCQKQIFSTS